MPGSVVVVLKSGSADAARSRSSVARPSKKLSRILTDYDAMVLRDATTATSMIVSVPDMERANRLAAALRKLSMESRPPGEAGEELP